MALFRDTADVSVRPAVPGDDAAITRVQLRAWRRSHADVLGAEVLESLDTAAVRDRWATAIEVPPSPTHRVLVALDGARVVGFAATAPTGPDAVEVIALEVDPDHQKGGHGSRLLAACVDLAREDGAHVIGTWVLDGDPARERFLTGSGLGPDGTARSLTAVDGPAERHWVAEI